VLGYFSNGSRSAALARAGLLITVIALVDWRVESNISLGFLYLFPMLLVGASLPRWQIAMAAATCSVLVEWFDPFPFGIPEGVPRMILAFAAFLGAGLFVFELTKNRQNALSHIQQIEKEAELRRDAEEQLKVLIESSPAAILTLDGEGRVLLANEAAHGLLGFETGSLPGEHIGAYLPALASVPSWAKSTQPFRTEMECRGRRRNGDLFLASAWFATYRTRSGPRLAAVVMDVSENLRDREESSLRQFMAGSRILVAMVCHEIRNLCGAIVAVHGKLGHTAALAGNEDYRALATLVQGLDKIASLELRQTTAAEMTGADLGSVLDELRIVIEPSLRESGVDVCWEIPASLPLVWADRQTLLQVFLNLTKNSSRAMESCDRKRLTIRAATEGERVLVRVEDSGPGISDPDRLFQPFQPGAAGAGLGLYVSRALIRGFRGDLLYEPRMDGGCFVIALLIASENNQSESPELVQNKESATVAVGRSYSVSGEPEPGARGRP
jgi:two-component system sensor kinase FixL